MTRSRIMSLMAIMLASLVLLAMPAQAAETIKNRDVLDMVAAKLADNTIVMAIQSSRSEFDVSPQALIELSKQGVPQDVIEAMIQAGGNGATVASNSAVSGGKMNPEEIILMDRGETTHMRYIAATLRTAARAMGFGGVAAYAVINGASAKLRIKNPLPKFIVAVPANAQPESYVTLANFAVRRNNTREVSVGGGYMSYSTGIPKDRVIPTTGRLLPDQSKAPSGFSIYELTPTAPLPTGEYALVTYNSQVRSIGFFAAGVDSYFDFGVD